MIDEWKTRVPGHQKACPCVRCREWRDLNATGDALAALAERPACSECGSRVLVASEREREVLGEKWVCYNDACPLNIAAQKQVDALQSIGVVIRWTIHVALLALVVGAAYGLWLLVTS